jgi:hypothetical protein
MTDPIATATANVRRFLGMPDDEPTELTFFYEGRVFLAHAMNSTQHVQLLRQAEKREGFNGAYQLVNGPLNPQLFFRYEPNKIHRGWNGRANDPMVLSLRALFLDCDPERIKGISATDAEKAEAKAVADAIAEAMGSAVGHNTVGRGDSGNGYFVLVALQPCEWSSETTAKISKLLGLLNRKFGVPKRVKIDTSVSNPARLMPAAGTWKRKGWNSPERPHRLTSFTCSETVERVPLEVLCG